MCEIETIAVEISTSVSRPQANEKNKDGGCFINLHFSSITSIKTVYTAKVV